MRGLSTKPQKYLTEQDKYLTCEELNLVNFTRKKLENSGLKLLRNETEIATQSRQLVQQKIQKLEHLQYCISVSARNFLTPSGRPANGMSGMARWRIRFRPSCAWEWNAGFGRTA